MFNVLFCCDLLSFIPSAHPSLRLWKVDLFHVFVVVWSDENCRTLVCLAAAACGIRKLRCGSRSLYVLGEYQAAGCGFHQAPTEGVREGVVPRVILHIHSWFCPRLLSWYKSLQLFPLTYFFLIETHFCTFFLAVGSDSTPIRWTAELMKSVSLSLSLPVSPPPPPLLYLSQCSGGHSVWIQSVWRRSFSC